MAMGLAAQDAEEGGKTAKAKSADLGHRHRGSASKQKKRFLKQKRKKGKSNA